MRTNLRHIVFVLTFGLGVAVASCEKSPTSPSTQPTRPTGPPAAAVVRLEIVGPASVEPGSPAQLTANAIKSDGSVENVSNRAQWTSTNSSVLQVGSGGTVSALARGEAVINARYASRSTNMLILALPAGTFRLTGRITDAGLPLDGVTVTVIGGTGEGLTTVTGASGTYALYGVAGQVSIQAKKEDFLNKIADVEVSANRAFDFEMSLGGERGDLSGTYTLSVEANGCKGLSENLRRRTYVADVEQHGSRLSVRLSGADFILVNGRGDHFAGYVAPDGQLSFTIGDARYYYYYYWGYFYSGFYGALDLVERLDSASALLVVGSVNATSTPSGISGALDGTIAQAQGAGPPFTRFSANCSSGSHRFEMRRQ